MHLGKLPDESKFLKKEEKQETRSISVRIAPRNNGAIVKNRTIGEQWECIDWGQVGGGATCPLRF